MKLDIAKAPEAQSGGQISIALLKLVSEARNEHGMRQLDYERYRHFCTSKTHRLRKTLQLTHKDSQRDAKPAGGKSNKSKRSKKKQTAATQSAADKAKGGNQFTEKTVEAASVDSDRPAQIFLFESERAWAHSQDLKTQSNEAGEDPSLRKSGLSRARRAVRWADDLARLVEALGDRIDVQSRAEVVAYVTSTKASAFFDRGNWDEALDHLAVARRLLSALAKSSSDTRGEALANSFVDSTEGQMRFCAYQLGEEEQDMDKVAEKRATGPVQERVCPQFASLIEKLTAGKQSTAQKETVEIEWQGKSIPIRNAELVDAVVRVRKEEEALQQSLTSTPAGGQPASSARCKGKKPQRLTHAERTARKRSSAAHIAGGESSSAAASRALSSSRSTNDPFDHALAALTDGELLARQLVDDNAEALSKSHSARYEAVGEDLKSAHEWMSYRLSSLQIKRSARLAEEVEVKAQKRELRKQAALKKNLAGQRRSTAPSSKKSKAMPKPTKEPRKPQPGSKPKQARKVPRAGRRRPAYSGTRRQRAKAQTSRATRAQSLLEGQARRRSARSIPALVKLLDSSEANLISISALSIVESDPDVSSVIDGKTAWYRAELLRHLARAHDLAEEKGHSCLLLRRAALSIRQARQALDLVEDVSVTQQLDGDIPPALNESTLDKADALIDATLRQVQREAFFASHGKRVHATAALSLTQTKAGQQLRSLAAKHVDFDPVDVEEALQMDPALQEECERELRQGYTAQKTKTPAAPTTVRGTDFATATGHAEEEADGDDHFVEAEHGAVTDEEDHDDEFGDAEQKDDLDVEQAQTSGGQAQQGQEQKAGWLGGWFGRK